MTSDDLYTYLRRKKSTKQLKKLIEQRMCLLNKSGEFIIENFLVEKNKSYNITPVQVINCLNDFVNGELTKFEFSLVLNLIYHSKKLQFKNKEVLITLLSIASPEQQLPMSFIYLKSLIYRP